MNTPEFDALIREWNMRRYIVGKYCAWDEIRSDLRKSDPTMWRKWNNFAYNTYQV
jgi:hypothetical protein